MSNKIYHIGIIARAHSENIKFSMTDDVQFHTATLALRDFIATLMHFRTHTWPSRPRPP